MTENKRVILIETNLFFLTKISAILRNHGYRAETARSFQEVCVKAESTAEVIIVNLLAPGIKALDVISEIKKFPPTKNIPMLGFAGHLAQDLFEQARAAGCDRVVSNGQLCANLPEILAEIKISNP